MPFEPGNRQSKGRPKGTPNRITKELRGTLRQFVETELEGLQSLREGLEPKDRAKLLTALLPYVIPKLESEGEGKPENPNEEYWYKIAGQLIRIA